MAGQPDQERGDPEAGGLGLHHRQCGQQLHPVAGQADLLLGLPQGGCGQVDVPGITLAAGQGELAAVDITLTAPDEHDDQLPVPGPVHRDEHRCLAHGGETVARQPARRGLG